MPTGKQSESEPEDGDLGTLAFEGALQRLEEIVAALEAGGLTLAEATQHYQQGVKLARLCSELLASAELAISRIQTAYGEQMRFLSESSEDSTEDEVG
jgi:exodeoxyribonuclease VII small subunit